MEAHRMTGSRLTSAWIPLLILLLDYVLMDVVTGMQWEHLSVRYGLWYQPPKTRSEAEDKGYTRENDICQMNNYHGFLYVHPHDDKFRVIFDYNYKLSGIQTMIPGNLHGHDTKNDTVRYPTKEVVPPILLFQDDGFGPQKFIVTAYFKHPSLICGPATTHVHTGRGLYIQTGYRVEKQYERIPLEARHLSDDWKTGTCLPSMGRHYFKNLSKDLQCEKLYPVFLMYNDEGQLGGFGLLFQGVPPSDPSRAPFKWFRHSVQFYPAIFDLTMLPPCMFNPEFHVFGYRVYLRDEHAMTCPRVQLPGISEDNAEGGAVRGGSKNEEVTFRPLNPALEPSRNSTSRPKPPKYIKPNTNVILDDVMKGAGSRNSASKNFLPISSIYFASLLVSLSPLANIYYVSMATRLTQKLSHLALR